MIEFYSFALSTVAFAQVAEQNLMLATPPSHSSPVSFVILLTSQYYKGFPELYEQIRPEESDPRR